MSRNLILYLKMVIVVASAVLPFKAAIACDRFESLVEQWADFDAQGQNQKALAIADELAQCVADANGQNALQQFSARWRRGASLGYLKDFTQSYQVFQQSIRAAEDALGTAHSEVIRAVFTFGDVAMFKRDYALAATQLSTALQRQRQAHPDGKPLEAKIRIRLARLASALGGASMGVAHLKQAVAIYRRYRAQHELALATALADLGRLLGQVGQLDEARVQLDAALAMLMKHKPVPYARVRTLYASGSVFEKQGAYGAAIDQYRDAVELCQQNWPKRPKRLGTAFNNLALAQLKSGAHGDAERHYIKALALFESAYGPHHLNVATVVHSLGEVYVHKQNYRRAVEVLKRALDIRKKELGDAHPKVAVVIGDLALALMYTGQLDEAQRYANESLALKTKRFGRQHPQVATSLDGLALLAEKRGDLDEAFALYEEALAIDRNHFPAAHPRIALRLNNLGTAHENLGRYREARPYFTQAYELLETAKPNSYKGAIALRHLSVLDWRAGDLTSALQKAEVVAQREEAHLREEIRLGSFAARDTFLRRFNLGTSLHLSMAFAERASPRAQQLGVQAVLGRKARATAENRRLNEALHADSVEAADVRTKLRAAHSALSRIHHGIDTNPGQDRKVLKRAAEALADQMSRTMRRSKMIEWGTKAIQARLGQNDLILDWIAYEPYDVAVPPAKAWRPLRYAVVGITARGAPRLVDVGDAATIHRLIKAWREALVGRVSRASALSKTLYQTLMSPFSSELATAERLYIAPDALLNLMPFGALEDGQGATLVSKMQIVRIPSARELLVTQPSRSSGSFIVFANPDFGEVGEIQHTSDRLGQFGALPGTAKEADRLSALLALKPSQIYTQKRATEAAFRRIQSPQILHVATHGFHVPHRSAQSDPRLEVGLALSSVNQRAQRSADDDGIITALDIGTLDLRGTQLVVLSACETQLGQVEPAEGLNGLQRALTIAGAQSIVASLWKVDDEATAALMAAFYRRLQKGESRAAALRSVQLDMASGRIAPEGRARAERGVGRVQVKDEVPLKDWRHPYYWASFTLSGADGPIEFSSHSGDL